MNFIALKMFFADRPNYLQPDSQVHRALQNAEKLRNSAGARSSDAIWTTSELSSQVTGQAFSCASRNKTKSSTGGKVPEEFKS